MNDREVRIGTDRDRTFARRETHDPRRIRAQLHAHLVDRDPAA
jgi:hypothetical protein